MDDAEKLVSGIPSNAEMLDAIWAVLKFDKRISESTFGQGHIYRCPNGHVYMIGECGGASEVSRCPQCGFSIGGTAHILRPGNSRGNDIAQAIQRRRQDRT